MNKVCYTCKASRTIEEFHRIWKGSEKRHNNCIHCHNLRQRKYAKKMRAKAKQKTQASKDWKELASELAQGELKNKPLSIHVRLQGSASFKALLKHLEESGLLENPEQWKGN